MSTRALILTLLLCLLPVGVALAAGPAQTPDPAIADGSHQERLDAARTTWKAARLRSYRYEVRRICFCPVEPGAEEDVVVIVRNASPRRFPKGLSSLATVPRLFRTIQKAIDAGVPKLEVSYGKRGVPRSIFVDRVAQAIDDEVRYTSRRFAALRGGAR